MNRKIIFYTLYGKILIFFNIFKLISISIFSYYYKKEEERLSGMLISFHYLLHISDCIKDCGPCWSFWQFPMERLCGILLPLVHSKLHPYKNLTNNILLLERFNHLSFVYPALADQLFGSSAKVYSEDKVFSLDNQVEEFYWPKRDYNLTVYELKQLKHFYSILFNIRKNSLGVRLTYIFK
jgi:hypothetical protein